MKLLAPERKCLLELLHRELGHVATFGRFADEAVAKCGNKKVIARYNRMEAAKAKKAAMVQKLILKIETPS